MKEVKMEETKECFGWYWDEEIEEGGTFRFPNESDRHSQMLKWLKTNPYLIVGMSSTNDGSRRALDLVTGFADEL